MHVPSLSPSLACTSAVLALLAAAPAHAAPPKVAPAFAPYVEVRTITTQLAGTPRPGAYVGRRLAVDRWALGGRIVVATETARNSPGRVDLVDPGKGTITPLGGPDLEWPTAVATPWPGTGFAGGVYYFQQHDFPKDPGASRRVHRLPSTTVTGLGVVFSATGMDAGSGLAFAPPSFGAKLGGQLYGSDSSNAPGAASGDGIRRWDAAGNFTNEIVGPVVDNPDTYTDVTFTGPEFGAYADRLVAINTTGKDGENILVWAESALLGDDPRQAYDQRQVFATSTQDPVARATYGAWGANGYLFAMSQANVYRYDANGKRVVFLTAAPGFNDVEFGAKRALYVADLYGGLYEVRPSPAVFSSWLLATGCGPSKAMAELVASWRTGETCPGAALVCGASQASCGGDCFSKAQQATIATAVAAICQNPC